MLMKSIYPLHDRIIIRRSSKETTTSFGIVIPESAAEKSDQGKVISVGPGKKNADGSRISLDLKEGDQVIFSKFAGQAIKIDEEELLVMREEDVIAVVRAV